MTDLLKPCFVALVLAMAAASPASAEEWKRPTAHGGELSRDVTREGYVYYGETTRTGPNGGSYSSSSTCHDGVAVNRCARSFSATGPEGNSWSGERYSARGPYPARSVGSVTGPNGNTAVGIRRHWR
jgi:hypothetical protein